MVEALKHPVSETEIAIVGKIHFSSDAYLSVVEALKHRRHCRPCKREAALGGFRGY